MQYDLNLVSTDELLNELRRRCASSKAEQESVPKWAMEVIKVCAEVWGTTAEEILETTNRVVPAAARTAAMGIVRFREKDRTLAELAHAFFRRDHSTLRVAVKRCDKKCREDAQFRQKLSEVLKRLNLTSQTCLSPHFAAG